MVEENYCPLIVFIEVIGRSDLRLIAVVLVLGYFYMVLLPELRSKSCC